MAEAAPRKEAAPRRKVTINTLMAKMRRGEQITQLAAYDYRTAVVSDRLGMASTAIAPPIRTASG